MAEEVETKVLDIDVEETKKKLLDLGAEKIAEDRIVVDWFDFPNRKEGEENWFLRIRTYSNGKKEVTWKARSEITGTTRRHKEINFELEEPEKLADLFQEIGLQNYAHQEKDRISFAYKDWRFDIDQYPKCPAFVEIEGKSEEHVKEAMKLLGLENNKTWADGERKLIQNIFGVNWYDMKF
ncbi:MAG TPA: CYTH domain-containing protein [Candidatus Paceibacterota bacterium]